MMIRVQDHILYENMILSIDLNLSETMVIIFTSYPKYIRKFLSNPNFILEKYTRNPQGLILDITGQIDKKKIIISKRKDLGNMDAEFSDPNMSGEPLV